MTLTIFKFPRVWLAFVAPQNLNKLGKLHANSIPKLSEKATFQISQIFRTISSFPRIRRMFYQNLINRPKKAINMMIMMWMEAKQLLNNRVQLNLINLVSSFPPISEALQPFIEAINKHHTSCERSFTIELAHRCLDDASTTTKWKQVSFWLGREGIVCMGTVWYVGGVFRKAGKLCVEGKLNEHRAVLQHAKLKSGENEVTKINLIQSWQLDFHPLLIHTKEYVDGDAAQWSL